jgi:hypothetical protein
MAAWADAFTGPVSEYYLDGRNMIYVVQGTSVVRSFPLAYGGNAWEGALAVSATIRTRASDMRGNADLGAGEYTLSGTPTGTGYMTPRTGNLVYYDGTTDETTNYFVDHGQENPLGGGVYGTDYYWQNPHFLFYPQALCDAWETPGCHGLSGIAYDPTNKSLWISSQRTSLIGDYAMDGTLLALFDTADPDNPFNTALGLDPITHTLWAIDHLSEFREYSLDAATFGNLLQVGTPSGLPSGWYGAGDFRVSVPEPASAVLLAPILAALLASQTVMRRRARANRRFGTVQD